MTSAMPAHAETCERREKAAVLVFPARFATVPGGLRDARGGGPPRSRELRREALEEEILALWEG